MVNRNDHAWEAVPRLVPVGRATAPGRLVRKKGAREPSSQGLQPCAKWLHRSYMEFFLYFRLLLHLSK